MKNIIYKNLWASLAFLGMFIFILAFNSCEDDDKHDSTPINVTNVYLEDAQSSVPDRPVTFARLGQTLRLEGSGFLGITKMYINGYDCYFNPVFITDNSMLVTVSRDVPTIDAPDDVKNTIRMEKNAGTYLVHPFDIRSAAPTITSITHTMPQAGEEITLYGSGLQGVTKITFPGDVVVTQNIASDDEDGRWCTVIVPSGVSDEGGALFLECANGGAYSPSYFNFKKGLLHNFDNVNNASWSNGEISDDLSLVIPSGGNLPKSQGIYRSLNKDGKEMAANDVPVDVTRYWINNGVWADIISESVIPWSTSTAECAIQMDIYYEGEWNSGDIRFVVADGWGSSRYCMIYAPWVVSSTRVQVENPGCWFTITLPFSDSEDFVDKDLSAVMAQIATATYKQGGPWMENGDIDGVASQPTNLNVYFDNIRIVPLTVPAYSDYGDEEE